MKKWMEEWRNDNKTTKSNSCIYALSITNEKNEEMIIKQQRQMLKLLNFKSFYPKIDD